MQKNTSEDQDFRALMSDVRPLAGDVRLHLERAPEITPGTLARRLAAESLVRKDGNFLSDSHVPLVEPHAELSFIRPGVQYGVFKRLRLGDYRFDSRLDLHGLTVEQSREALWRFVADCMKHDVRAALINHGKGAGRSTPALLKSCVAMWLPQFAEVLAFHSAPRHLGGTGATVILLRKSERARQENFEKHSKRAR